MRFKEAMGIFLLSLVFINEYCRLELQGVAGQRTRADFKELLKAGDLGAMCMLETITSDVTRLLNITAKLGFDSHFIMDPLGFAVAFY